MATAKELRDKFLAIEAAKNALEDSQPKLVEPLGDGFYVQVDVNAGGVFIGRSGQSLWMAEKYARELKRALGELFPD